MYLSLDILASILSIILMVVSSPTSEEIRICSKLSKTSSSTVALPTTALEILLKMLVLVFSNPLSRSFSFSFVKNLSKNPMMNLI